MNILKPRISPFPAGSYGIYLTGRRKISGKREVVQVGYFQENQADKPCYTSWIPAEYILQEALDNFPTEIVDKRLD